MDTALSLAGDLTIDADNSAKLNATISNAAVSAASALFGAGGSAASGLLASNMVISSAEAYLDYTSTTGTPTVGGAVSITAKDAAGIYANTKLVSSSTTTNDGGTSILNETIGDVIPADFLSGDGWQTLKFGDKVRLADDYPGDGTGQGNAGRVYTYLGPDGAAAIDLGNADYTDKDFWKEHLATQIVPEGLNISDSDSMAIGGLVVRNDVRSEVGRLSG